MFSLCFLCFLARSSLKGREKGSQKITICLIGVQVLDFENGQFQILRVCSSFIACLTVR